MLQLEYTPLGQYAGAYQRIASILFEHDIYFQSIGRGLASLTRTLEKISARFEYLRALRYELRMLPHCDRIQVCTRDNKEYLASFAPGIREKLQDGLRAGIDTSRYEVAACPREPETMLFLGSFRHTPNAVAIEWFARKVMPLVLASRPAARLVVIGRGAAALPVRRPRRRDRVPRICGRHPGGAGQVRRLRLPDLERLGRAGETARSVRGGNSDGVDYTSERKGSRARTANSVCWRMSPEQFAQKILRLFENPAEAAELAARAREEVVSNWDMAVLTRRLEESYREVVREKRRP